MIIDEADIETYLQKFNAIQLRENKRTAINAEYPYYNFGESKGLEFQRVLIYPTKPMWDWIVNKNSLLKEQSKARLYVAVTRARDSVVFVRRDVRDCGLPVIKL